MASEAELVDVRCERGLAFSLLPGWPTSPTHMGAGLPLLEGTLRYRLLASMKYTMVLGKVLQYSGELHWARAACF